jgi:hypothetical protein
MLSGFGVGVVVVVRNAGPSEKKVTWPGRREL